MPAPTPAPKHERNARMRNGAQTTNTNTTDTNRQWDDETGEPTRLVGFDAAEPTAHNKVTM